MLDWEPAQKLMKQLFLIIMGVMLSSTLAKGQTCYISETGSKYHMKSCSTLEYSKLDISLKRATKFGFEACKLCKPTAEKLQKETTTQTTTRSLNSSGFVGYSRKSSAIRRRANAVRCIGKTKAKTRCKRMTKNSTSKCYQHQTKRRRNN